MTGREVVVADANILINWMHVRRLDLLTQLPGLSFAIPDHVYEEILYPEQKRQLERALDSEKLRRVSIENPQDIVLFTRLIDHLGRGEAACLVLASRNGWLLASDEKRRFRREAIQRLGENRLLSTVDLFLRAIRSGVMSVEEADSCKRVLEERRFKMSFRSFRERL